MNIELAVKSDRIKHKKSSKSEKVYGKGFNSQSIATEMDRLRNS